MAPDPAPQPADANAQTVTRAFVLMLDGVPWAVMDSLHRAGHFRGFASPSRVLSTFPSLTTLAFRDIWRESPTRGYEERYFDRADNRLRGGAWDVLSGKESSEGFHRHVDVEGAPMVSGLAYAFPLRIAPIEYNELRQGVLERLGRDSIVVAYSISTDAVAHAEGRGAQVAQVLRLETLVDEVRRRVPGVRVDIFSDHGNDFVPSHRIALDVELRRAGFSPADRLRRPGDVVIPRFGLVGSVAVYAATADRARLAQALARATGVEFAIWDSAGAVMVQSAGGRARVQADAAGARYRYTPEAGDPLRLAAALERLRAAGELDEAGFAPDTAWLRETLGTPWEDSLRRLILCSRGAVLNPATVLVSLSPGHHFGDPIGDAFTRMEGTHGSLRSSGSTAFLMSTAGPRPAIVRSDDVLGWLPEGIQATTAVPGVRQATPAAEPRGS
ncbi:MAG TPA: hypothetical protein VF832_15845 [Longimicrobiales bacterium]